MDARQFALLMKITEIVQESIRIDSGKLPGPSDDPNPPTQAAGPKDKNVERHAPQSVDDVMTQAINQAIRNREIEVRNQEAAPEITPDELDELETQGES